MKVQALAHTAANKVRNNVTLARDIITIRANLTEEQKQMLKLAQGVNRLNVHYQAEQMRQAKEQAKLEEKSQEFVAAYAQAAQNG